MTSSRESSLCLTPTPGSTSGQIPKFGTLIPNRVFVGGISSDTSENELKYFFSSYGAVKDCKIILDRGGISKSYGFVTFENQEDAERIIRKEGDSLIFKDRKLNVGPAIRKQQTFPKLCEPNLPQAAYIYQNGLYAVPNTMAVLCHPDGYVLSPQAQTSSYPVLMTPHQSVGYYPSPPAGFAPTQWQSPNQWRWASQNMPNVPGIMPTAAGSLMYPMNITPDMMFAQMSSSGPATSSTTCQQSQERQEASTSSVMEHAGECGNSLVQNMREQHFSKFTPPRNQHYMY